MGGILGIDIAWQLRSELQIDDARINPRYYGNWSEASPYKHQWAAHCSPHPSTSLSSAPTLSRIMVLKLYGSMKPESKCTQRVLIILKEKNVPFEVHAIDSAKGENKTPEYLVKQPFGQFPCIVSYLSTTVFLVMLIAVLGRRWLHSF